MTKTPLTETPSTLTAVLERHAYARRCPSCQGWFAPGPRDHDGCSVGCDANLREQARLHVRRFRWEQGLDDDD